jgi:hypothetical protein
MFMPVMLKSTIFAVLLLAVMSGSVPAEAPPPSDWRQEYLKKLDQPILLRGDYFKAVLAAYEDFSHTLAENDAAARSDAPRNRDLSRLMSKIENFDIGVSQTNTDYLVDFAITFRGGDPLMVTGGGTHYVVDRHTFKIKEKTLRK